MAETLEKIVRAYNASAPLAEAQTIPASWYTDVWIAELEKEAVFGRTWQAIGRRGQVAEPGAFFTIDFVGAPLVVARDADGVLRAFYNVCRHHAAAFAQRTERRPRIRERYDRE